MRKPAAPAGQAIVQQRSKSAINKRSHKRGPVTGAKKKAAKRVKEGQEWEMEGIAAIMRDKGQIQFWVKWVDWPVGNNTWEPKKNVQDTDDYKHFSKIADLLESLPEVADPKGGKKGKGRPKRVKVEDDVGKQEDGDYEIEQVLGVCWDFENDQLEYLVKWAGWPQSSNSWEPEENMNASDLMKPFSTLADHLIRVWGNSGTGSGTSSKKSTPASSAKSPAGKRGRKRAAPVTPASGDEEEGDEVGLVVKDENGDATDAEATDDEAVAEAVAEAANGAAAASDEEETGAGDEEPSPKKSRRTPAKKSPAKKTPAKGKRTPAKKRSRR